MEWWETDQYLTEGVYRTNGNVGVGGSVGNKHYSVNFDKHGVDVGYGNIGNANIHSASYGQIGKTAAAGAAVGAGLYGAYRAGKYAYNKLKGNNQQQQPQAPAKESFDWSDDPDAMDIMESYFSEFADADMYAPEPQPYNEWDA